MKSKISLIIGNGEIGSSLKKVLDDRQLVDHSCIATDIKDDDFLEILTTHCEVLHICIPYEKENFERDVIAYINLTQPKFTVIHSTVQVGTTRKLIEQTKTKIVHSPVQGQHPDLAESILYFEKIVGTEDIELFERVCEELSNVKCVKVASPEASEIGKIFSTSYYGICIAWHREMKRLCDKYGVPFEDAVTKFNEIYNAGYAKFKPNVIRPVLTPPEGPIGGHCVTQNARLFEEIEQSEFIKLIQ